jgi:hypothetical protein
VGSVSVCVHESENGERRLLLSSCWISRAFFVVLRDECCGDFCCRPRPSASPRMRAVSEPPSFWVRAGTILVALATDWAHHGWPATWKDHRHAVLALRRSRRSLGSCMHDHDSDNDGGDEDEVGLGGHTSAIDGAGPARADAGLYANTELVTTFSDSSGAFPSANGSLSPNEQVAVMRPGGQARQRTARAWGMAVETWLEQLQQPGGVWFVCRDIRRLRRVYAHRPDVLSELGRCALLQF